MARSVRSIAVLLSGFLVAGCNFWLAGHSEDYTMIVHGQGVIDMNDQSSTFDMLTDGSTVTCKGKTVPVLKKPEIIGSTSSATVVCSDGRKGTGSTIVTSMEGGTGNGTDECGNSFVFVWNIHQHQVASALEGYRNEAKRRNVVFADRCDAPGDAPPHRDPLI